MTLPGLSVLLSSKNILTTLSRNTCTRKRGLEAGTRSNQLNSNTNARSLKKPIVERWNRLKRASMAPNRTLLSMMRLFSGNQLTIDYPKLHNHRLHNFHKSEASRKARRLIELTKRSTWRSGKEWWAFLKLARRSKVSRGYFRWTTIFISCDSCWS